MRELFSGTNDEMDVTALVRQRVNDLLKDRPEITNREFGLAIGQKPSWVSEFRRGRRHANQLRTVTRMAKFFVVSVGYLIGEAKDETPADGQTALLLAAWSQLTDDDDRALVLSTAQRLRDTALKGRGRTGARPTDRSDDAPHHRRRRGRAESASPLQRKGR